MLATSSTGISTDSKPHRLNRGKSRVLSLVNDEVNRNVLMPKRINRIIQPNRDNSSPTMHDDPNYLHHLPSRPQAKSLPIASSRPDCHNPAYAQQSVLQKTHNAGLCIIGLVPSAD